MFIFILRSLSSRVAFKPHVMEMFNSDMRAGDPGLVDIKKLRALYTAFLDGRRYLNGRHFFRVYAFESFVRRFEANIRF